MWDWVWPLVAWVGLYLFTGALVGRLVVRRLSRHTVDSDRRWLRRISRFLEATRTGAVVTVVLWPPVVMAYRVGFFLGAWDWRGRPARDDTGS